MPNLKLADLFLKAIFLCIPRQLPVQLLVSISPWKSQYDDLNCTIYD